MRKSAPYSIRLETRLGIAYPYQPIPRLAEILGVAYLHRANLENGVFQEPGDRCLLTDAGMPRLAKTADVEKSIEYFEWFLAQQPNDLEVRWLLNLAYMSLGRYPTAVPAPPRFGRLLGGSGQRRRTNRTTGPPRSGQRPARM